MVQIALTMLGKVFVSGAFSIVYLFSAEIFPTVARNAGIGICSTVARIGSALSPFMRDLVNIVLNTSNYHVSTKIKPGLPLIFVSKGFIFG